MSYIPIDLIVKILHKTPAESLLRLKFTCKKWYTFINDKGFMYNHFDHSPERFIRASGDDQAVHNFDPVTAIHSVSPMPNEFCVHPTYKMVHCDGLMLCVCTGFKYEFTNPNEWKLAIWNPVLRIIRWIEPRIHFGLDDHFGIGYDKQHRDNYKILRVPLRLFDDDGDDDDDDDDAKCKIYEPSKSDSWRTIEAKFEGALRTEGVSVKGNMYWIVERHILSIFIISFDFSTETFKDICVCPNYWNLHLGCFNRNGLSLFLRNYPKEINVWVINNLSDEIVSFTKYFDMVLPMPHYLYPTHRPAYSLVNHRKTLSWGELTVEEDGEWSTWITRYKILEGETGRFDLAYYCDGMTRSYVYVPSLIPVP